MGPNGDTGLGQVRKKIRARVLSEQSAAGRLTWQVSSSIRTSHSPGSPSKVSSEESRGDAGTRHGAIPLAFLAPQHCVCETGQCSRVSRPRSQAGVSNNELEREQRTSSVRIQTPQGSTLVPGPLPLPLLCFPKDGVAHLLKEVWPLVDEKWTHLLFLSITEKQDYCDLLDSEKYF